MSKASPLTCYRVAMSLFISGLVISGVTAFPLLLELRLIADFLGISTAAPAETGGFTYWIFTVRHGLEETYLSYPWVAYGTDWLAFGHLVIAAFFVAPLIQPATSRPTLYTGIGSCIAVIPLALICGPIRGIPLYWRLIDCSFSVIGIIPLLYCLKMLRRIEAEPRPVPQD